MRRWCFGLMGLMVCSAVLGPAKLDAADLAPLLKTLREVGHEGKGYRAATAAWAQLTEQGRVEQLPQILAAFDGAELLAVNWLRGAVDTIAERQLQAQGKLPITLLESFLKEKQHDPRARRLAYEWIVRDDPTARERLIPGMLDDPSLELRRDAVARVLSAAEEALKQKNNEQALAGFRQALDAARDLDQVKVVTEALKQLGRPVDLPRHFGFLQDWQLVGPFDNQSGNGFEMVYEPEKAATSEPEKAIDLMASYATPDGSRRWSAHHTDDEYGNVDLNKALGKHMAVAAYALATFQSDRQQPIELRLGSESALKIWLNGKLLFSADVYHANGTMDQYVGRGELKPGRNTLLLKICQNNQTETWAQDWKFQLRVCDALGKAVLATDRPGPKTAKKETVPPASKE